jgi:hypothetical protein
MITAQVFASVAQKARRILPILGLAIGAAILHPTASTAQHFISDAQSAKRVVVEADDLDSIIYHQQAFFAVPAIPDTIGLVYHEPMPDSVMPRSAIVLGTVTIQAEEAEEVVEQMEEFARKHGADWVVSFEEPRKRKNKDGDFYYRSSATLMRVLDDAMIPQSQVAYSTFRESGLNSYASVMDWYDTYGRYLGANVKQLDQQVEEESDEEFDY